MERSVVPGDLVMINQGTNLRDPSDFRWLHNTFRKTLALVITVTFTNGMCFLLCTSHGVRQLYVVLESQCTKASQ